MFDKGNLRDALWLYGVTDDAWLDGRDLEDCVAEALAGGATFIQLRRKGATTENLAEEGKRLQILCAQAGVPFVIDDDVEAALLAGADGVHVGQEDMACARARERLGDDAIIGVSTQTVDQALAAEAAGADYLGVGAVAVTATKPEARVLSPEEVKAIVDAVSIPVVAIGGIDGNTAKTLRGTGVAGAAVVSAIFAADDITKATAHLDSALEDVLR